MYFSTGLLHNLQRFIHIILPSNLKPLIVLLLIFLPAIKSLLIQPTGPTVAYWADQSIVLSCIRDKDEDNYLISWLKDNQSIRYDNRVIQSGGNDSKVLQLLIYESVNSDSGNYSCVLRDKQTKIIHKSESLFVLFYPTISQIGREVFEVTEHLKANLSCKFRIPNDFTSTVVWKRKDKSVSESEKYSIESRKKPEGPSYFLESRLIIKDVTQEDKGQYACQVVVSSEHKSDIVSFNVTLKVMTGPKFLTNISDTAWLNSESPASRVVLSCVVDAHPPADITWFSEKGELLAKSNEYYKFDMIISTNNNTLVLISKPLHVNRRRDEKYRCDAINRVSRDFRFFYVKTGSLPSPPKIGAYSIADDILTITLIESLAEPRVNKYRVEIAGKKIEFKAVNGTSVYTVPLKNVPGGNHKFGISAFNDVGWSNTVTEESMLVQVNGVYKLISIDILGMWIILLILPRLW